MSRFIFSLLFVLILPTVTLAADFDFSPYARLLKTYLSADQRIHGIPANTLDYARIDREQAGENSDWRTLLGTLASFEPATISDRDQRMAFWINVYNIAAIKTILDNWPVDSITSSKIHWLGFPWKRDIILVGGQDYSLYQIEYDQLVEGFEDLRVHLGINCASTSCVDLLPVPYTGTELDRQLQQQGERLARQTEKGLRIDHEERTVYVSKIFDFDARHFNRWAGGAINFLSPYLTAEDRATLQREDFELDYLDYDWTVNASGQAGN